MTLIIHVYGLPAPQGSKRHVGNGVMVESSKQVKPWREAVKWAALQARTEQAKAAGWADHLPPESGPVSLAVSFYMPRPKSHYGTGKNAHLVKDSAPEWPAGKPDLDKLVRSTMDALSEAAIWRDDSQVAFIQAVKTYSVDGVRAPGADIIVRPK